MTETFRPETEEEVARAVRLAFEHATPIEVVGAGSMRGLGRPLELDRSLDLTHLVGVSLYEPNELVMTAATGTPRVEVEAALAEHRQILAFEPPDLGPLYGGPPERGTVGGVFACNLSGPRRFQRGAARDHLLGFRGVSGRGENFKSGGRVMKNVTGYDLSKLVCGSYGTLAVLTEVTFKVLPRPDESRTLLALGAADAPALELLRQCAAGPNDVSGLAHLPVEVASRSRVGEVTRPGTAATAIRVEGPASSVAERITALRTELSGRFPLVELSGPDSAALWREVRDAAYFARAPGAPLWRISLTASRSADTVAGIAAGLGASARWFYDWAGGLVWLELSDGPLAERVRPTVARAGGHATLVRASSASRTETPVFEPLSGPLGELTRRVKESFDPGRILNPGRMYAGV